MSSESSIKGVSLSEAAGGNIKICMYTNPFVVQMRPTHALCGFSDYSSCVPHCYGARQRETYDWTEQSFPL